MHSRRVAFVSALTALTLCVAVGSASANKLSFSETAFRGTWSPLRAYMFFREALPEIVSCNVTMEGSFHSSTFRKVARSLIGLITRVTLAKETCREGTITFLTEALPWLIRYESFIGQLPQIGRLNVQFIGLAFQENWQSTITCLARSTEATPMVERIDREAGGVIRMSSSEEIRLPPTNPFCLAESLSYEGEVRVTKLVLGTSITLTLI